jgi:2-polyprenyl-3-methyl-5-hydroxy-6-metoxy-1,4-benzoquinol methylase
MKDSRNRADYYLHHRRELCAFLPEEQQIVLEVGCGAGNFGQTLNAVETWGVEPDRASCQVAAQHYTRILNGYYENVESLIPDNHFDLIVCNDVIEHMADHRGFLQSLHRKLKSSGNLVGSVPNVRYYDNLFNLLCKKDWCYVDSGILDRTHLRFFTEKSLRLTLVNAGFRVDMLEGINSTFRKGIRKKPGKFLVFALLSAFTFGNTKDIEWLQFGFRAVKVEPDNVSCPKR